ncbi:MAG TPA: hypothetical protein VFL45_03655 [Gammaproteobacteria bacterium]|nr:hypothetical protein [Gammaproteobacteria bacterium]
MNTFNWLVKRELWENRSFWLVPLAMTVLVVLAYIAGIVAIWVHGVHITIDGHSGASLAAMAATHAEDVHEGLTLFYISLTTLFNFVLIIMVIRYLLQCLYDDRRDRSILFWQSLPISDTTTVLSKLFVVMVVAPLATFALLLVVQLVGAGAVSAVAGYVGVPAGMVWTQSDLGGIWAYLVVGFLVQSLWYLPFYGWLMMASAWARRAPVLWAAVPVLVAGIVEGIVFQTNRFLTVIGHHAISMVPGIGSNIRVNGKAPDFDAAGVHGFAMHTLAATLGSASMWIGVGIGIVFVAAAIMIRRYRAEDY